MRKIIHVDMDAFFASVEQRDNPALRGKPVVVGGAGPRSVVAAASYEARQYGIYSALPMSMAIRRCPDLVIVNHRFQVYKEVSHQIREIFKKYTDLVEPLSLDEAYLDVTENKFGIESAIRIALLIKAETLSETMLTASAGVSMNKFLAKVASGINKPNGLKVILPEEAERFIEELPIEKFFGVGKATAEKMKSLGINNGFELKLMNEVDLVSNFGKMGRYFYRIARCIDDRAVQPTRIRKSISSERTFEQDLIDEHEIEAKIQMLSISVATQLSKLQKMAKTVQIKIRFDDFETITRQLTLEKWTDKAFLLESSSMLLFNQLDRPLKPIRLIGVGVANLSDDSEESDTQLSLFTQ
jgi:DNA polymerase-4